MAEEKQLNVKKIPDWLLKEAQIKAIREDRSLSEVVRELLEQWVGGELKPKQEERK